MSTDERSTHFQGFAKLLWDDIEDALPDKVFAALFDANEIYDVEKRAMQIIAEHTYDLVYHTVQHITSVNLNIYKTPDDQIVKTVPDMTERPKQEAPLQGKGE